MLAASLLALLLAPAFADPPAEAGMSMYWIWFGPAQTRAGVGRDNAARMIRIRGSREALKPGEEIVATFGDRVVVSMPTGMMVKRASLGEEGFVLDHYSRRALQTHLDAAGEKLWDAVKEAGIRSFWCDSLERNGRLDRLVSWTEIPALRHFSGSLAHTAEIDAPAPSGLLGPVRLLVSAK